MAEDRRIADTATTAAGGRGRFGVRFLDRFRTIEPWKAVYLLLGSLFFLLAIVFPPLGPATSLQGDPVPLTREGQAALGLFLLALVWWGAEAVPLGVTGLAVGALQVLASIRPAREALGDFMDPMIGFLLGALVLSLALAKTGLARRMSYKVLVLAGERTSRIYLACLLLVSGMTLIMVHTTVAAVVFPLFMAVHALYSEDNRPTRFGKGLFTGLAFAVGAGSVMTLLGSARAAFALGFFREAAGRSVGFCELACAMAPLGVVMTVLLWGYTRLRFPPERETIPGLQDRMQRLYARLGPMTGAEWLTLATVAAVLGVFLLGCWIPCLASLELGAVLLSAVVLLFAFRVLGVEDLEEIPLNILLLFGGAMSLGLGLWKTGASAWLAALLVGLCGHVPATVFLLGLAGVVLMATNVVLNAVVIALVLPTALVAAVDLGVAPDMVLYAVLAAAGLPCLSLAGAAPNAIAFGSRQYTRREFFAAGLPVSLLLMLVLAAFVSFVWPALGIPLRIR